MMATAPATATATGESNDDCNGDGGDDDDDDDDDDHDNDTMATPTTRQTRLTTSISSQFVMRIPHVFTWSSKNKNVNFIAVFSMTKWSVKVDFVRHVLHVMILYSIFQWFYRRR